MVQWPGQAVAVDENDDEEEAPNRWEKYQSDAVQNSNNQLLPLANVETELVDGDGNVLFDPVTRVADKPQFTKAETAEDVARSYSGEFNNWLATAAGTNVRVRDFVNELIDDAPDFVPTQLPKALIGAVTLGVSKDQAWHAFNQLGIDKYEPKTAAGRVGAQAGWESGMTLPFMLTGGAVALNRAAAQFGEALSIPHLVKQQVLRPYIERPAQTAAIELTAGAGAGAGGQISNEIFGENIWGYTFSAIVGGIGAGGITSRMTRAKSGSRELVQLMDDASLPDGRLPGHTVDESKIVKASVVTGGLDENRMAAQAMSDDFVLNNQEAGIGPLFGEDTAMIAFTKQLDDQFPGLDPIARQGQIDYVHRRLTGEQKPRVGATAKQEDYERFISESLDATTTAKKFIDPKKVKNAMIRGLTDKSGNLNREILKAAGPVGEKAMQRFHTAKGATPYAAFRFRRASSDVFGGLSNLRIGKVRRAGGANVPSIRKDFDQYLFNQRGREATRTQTLKGEKPFLQVKNAKGKAVAVTDENFQVALRGIEDRIGPVWTQEFRARSARYFSSMADNITRLDEEGLLLPGERAKLQSSIYLPKKFIDDIDPVIEVRQGSAVKSVRSSGIQKMEGGGLDYVDLSAEDLLAQTMARTEGRIFRNRAAREFYRIGETLPDNGMIALKRPQRDGNAQRWVQFTAVDQGKAKKFYMHPDIVPEYLADDVQGMTYKVLSVASGTKFAKAMITGANPAIVPILFARDMSFIIQTTRQYNRYFKPVGYGQMAEDLVTVAKDVVTRTGRVEDYFREGGGMNFLTHQGRIVDETTMTGRTQEIMHVLGWFGETGELMTRLALRERGLKNGLSPEDATYVARNYMDFAQGGEWVKSAESVAMYINAAALGWRNTVRSAKKDPTGYAAGIANTMAAYTALYWYNKQANPEAIDALSARQRASGAYITTPYSRIDDKGNVRHTVIKLPTEPSMIPVMILTNAILDRTLSGKEPDEITMESIRGAVDALSIGTTTSPTAEIFLTFKNYSTWRNDEIWNGAAVEYGAEVKEYPDRATSDFAQDMAKMLQGLPDMMSSPIESPERLASAMKIAAGGNMYAQSFSGTYQAFRNLGPDVGTDWQQVTQYMPFANRFVRETHPMSTQIEQIERMEKELNTPIVLAKRNIDQQVAMLVNREPGAKSLKKITMDAMKLDQSGELGPAGMQSAALAQRIQRGFQIGELYRKYGEKLPPGSPSQSQILSLMSQPAQIQARVVYEWLRDAEDDPVNGTARRRMLNQVRGVARAFSGENFQRSFQQIEREDGKVKR